MSFYGAHSSSNFSLSLNTRAYQFFRNKKEDPFLRAGKSSSFSWNLSQPSLGLDFANVLGEYTDTVLEE